MISSAFKNNEDIPKKYTCDGDNINPPLEITDIPEAIKSLALIVDDPDAPAGTWIHWLVWNIDPKKAKIKQGKIPSNVGVGTNSFGKQCYNGPCPPAGKHRYVFTIYALDDTLIMNSSARVGVIKERINEHIIDQAELIGKYQRK